MWFIHNGSSPHFPALSAPESEFRWTVDRKRRTSQLACTISWLQSSGFIMLWWYLDTLLHSAPVTDVRGIRITSREYLSGDLSEIRHFQKSAHLSAPKSICCRDHMNIAHISAGIDFCRYVYVDWDLFAHLSEYCTHLKPATFLTFYLSINLLMPFCFVFLSTYCLCRNPVHTRAHLSDIIFVLLQFCDYRLRNNIPLVIPKCFYDLFQFWISHFFL
jgi:hypothetical protein